MRRDTQHFPIENIFKILYMHSENSNQEFSSTAYVNPITTVGGWGREGGGVKFYGIC